MMTRKLIEEQKHCGSELQLWEHFINGKREYEMIINGVFIMASYNYLSSELLVREAMKRIKSKDYVNILIGGLGMGFTVKEACSFSNVSNIDVVEIEPTIAEWNKSYFSDSNQNCLDDERVNVIIKDFYEYVMNTRNLYDIISMDIDNGPALLVREGNRRVYSTSFFRRVKEIMKPGAVFVIWSGNYDQNLVKQTKEVFLNCDVEEVIEEQNGRKILCYLYFAY
ncbi:MAG: hypothetical protein H0Z39_04355 [Peptococcaceae bacterium]|nr:hypothetical protein [Peptococcaceae bacterium]